MENSPQESPTKTSREIAEQIVRAFFNATRKRLGFVRISDEEWAQVSKNSAVNDCLECATLAYERGVKDERERAKAEMPLIAKFKIWFADGFIAEIIANDKSDPVHTRIVADRLFDALHPTNEPSNEKN